METEGGDRFTPDARSLQESGKCLRSADLCGSRINEFRNTVDVRTGTPIVTRNPTESADLGGPWNLANNRLLEDVHASGESLKWLVHLLGGVEALGFLEDVHASGESLERLLLLLGMNHLEGVHGAGSTIVHPRERTLTARADHTCEWFVR